MQLHKGGLPCLQYSQTASGTPDRRCASSNSSRLPLITALHDRLTTRRRKILIDIPMYSSCILNCSVSSWSLGTLSGRLPRCSKCSGSGTTLFYPLTCKNSAQPASLECLGEARLRLACDDSSYIQALALNLQIGQVFGLLSE